MKRFLSAGTFTCMLLLGLGWSGGAHAQGVTTSAIAGTVANQQGEPVSGAQVVATNTATGAEYRVTTRANGRYLLPGLQPGGPYRIDVRALGYAATARTGVNLALSQTAEFNFTVAPEAIALEGIAVTAEGSSAVISKGRTGTATVVSDSAIARLPTITRDFTDFTRLTPQISTGVAGTSAGGRNNRFNSIQIDGAVNNDLFGLAASGTPGGQANARPITLEAIQEFQVVIAPFDVRQGGFTGAGINAITKSGTNDIFGSVAYFARNQDLVGKYNLAGGEVSPPVADFDQSDLAFSLGGPILRDRAFFFIAGERSRRSAPINAIAGTQSSDISVAEAQQVADFLRTAYGYDAGTVGALNLDQGSNNLVGRLDFNINDRNRLTLRHNYVDASDQNLGRGRSSYNLGNAGYEFASTTNSSVAQLNSNFGSGVFNEFRLGYTRIRDSRQVADAFPRVTVRYPSGSVVAGTDNFSGRNALDQDVVELTNDVTVPYGSHTFVVGTSNEFFEFSNLFVRNPFGNYTFDSFAAFEEGRPSRFENSYLLPGGRERAEFPVRRYAVYLQDTWDVTNNLTLTGGLRYDVSTLPDNPGFNPAVEEAVDRRTDRVPSGNGLFNPRVGFNWDVTGDAATQVRGGIGLFSGRTPYVWISNAYGNTGLDYVRFTCGDTASAPAFVADPNNQPTTCRGTTALAPNEINTVDPGFEQPQVFRTSLGFDRRLAFGFTGTLEGLYTKTVHDVLYRNLLVTDEPVGTVEGRPAYGRVRVNGIGDIIDVTNTGEGYTYSLTAQVQRPFLERYEVSAAYTYSQARDVQALGSSQAISNWRFNPTNGDPNNPGLGRSRFEIPHRFLFAGTYQATLLRRTPTDFSFIYVGESGRPYSFTYNSDINGDGSFGNDLLYVPTGPDDIRFEELRAPGTANPRDRGNPISAQESYQNLNALIEGVECLRQARGQVIERNSCQEPWQNRLDVRIAQAVPTLRGQNAQITVDILNFANLLNRDWGVSKFVSNQNLGLLNLAPREAGNNAADAEGRRLYSAFGPRTTPFSTNNLSSRYQIQLGVRYTF